MIQGCVIVWQWYATFGKSALSVKIRGISIERLVTMMMIVWIGQL